MPPFLITAANSIEFTPTTQDADKYERRALRDIDKRVAAAEREMSSLRRRAREGLPDAAPDHPGFEEQQKAVRDEIALLADERGLVERKARFMRERFPVPQTFYLAVASSVERERINSRLTSLGLQQVSLEQIRATMVEELFHQDWTPPGVEPFDVATNEATAEANADFLDSCWLRQEAHDEATRQWKEQEIERVLDEMDGAPRVERAEVPPKIITVREQARLTLLFERMMRDSQRLRDLAAQQMAFNSENAMLLVRIHVVGVAGFEPTEPIVRDPRTNALPASVALALREQVDDVSWNELVAEIDRMYQLDGAERKNSDSRLEKPQPPAGSVEPSAEQGNSGGSSTESRSAPAPAAASETITEPSSGFTSDFGKKPEMVVSNDSLTADP